MIEKESLTHRIEDDMEIRNRNWDIIKTHLRNYTEQRQQDQLKVAKVEKDLNDYQKVMSQVNVNQEAKQKVTGYGIVSLPKNTANGQVSSIGIKGETRTNLVKSSNMDKDSNGDGVVDDFNKWTTPTVTSNITFDSVKKAQKVEITGGTATVHTEINQYIYNINPGDVVSARVNAEVIGNVKVRIDMVWYNDSTHLSSSIGTLTTSSEVKIENRIAPINTNRVHFLICIVPNSIGDIGTVWLKNAIVEKVSAIGSYVSSGTKSTISAIRLKSVGKNLWGIKHDSNKMFNQIASNVLNGTEQIPNYKNYIVGKIKVKKQIYTIIPDEKTTFIPNTKSPYVLFTKNGYVEKGILIVPNQIRAIELDGEYDIILGSYWSRQLDKNDYCNLKYLGIDEEYEPYKESTAYVIAKDKDNKIVNLRSLPNGTKDEIRLSEGKAIIKIGTKTDVASGTVINYTDMADGGQFVAYYEDGTQQVGIKGDTLTATATTLIYQLAEPEIIPIEVSGNIVAHPNGTIYVEQATFSTGIYNDNMKVMCNDLPIKSINKIIKIDYETGVEHELDTLKAVISEDKLSFAHPDLTNGDIVFFDYEYDLESTHGETTVEFYDSRYTIKDSVTGKFYQWNVTVADGVPSIDLKEV